MYDHTQTWIDERGIFLAYPCKCGRLLPAWSTDLRTANFWRGTIRFPTRLPMTARRSERCCCLLDVWRHGMPLDMRLLSCLLIFIIRVMARLRGVGGAIG